MDFLSRNNHCGQTLLRLVSRGNALVAELLRLSEFVPAEYRLERKADEQKYASIIADFSYFRSSDAVERRIELSKELTNIDNTLRDTNLQLLTRFYLAFESVHRYATALVQFLDDLDDDDGQYIQQSVESVTVDDDGRQLLCEAFYIYGVLLLLCDLKFPGPVRERMLVAYYRYSGQQSSSESSIDDVCMLLRSTGFIPGGKRPPNYPEEYFARVPVARRCVSMLIGRLRTDDIYHRTACYPLPEHRSTALATQAAMLYIILYFSPQTLHNDTAAMREIVDKLFVDNWVFVAYLCIQVKTH